MRLLWHAINGLGLGHVVRLLAIARQVRLIRPAWQSAFLTNSDASSVISQEGFAVFKVPSRTSFTEAHFRVGQQLRLAQAAALSVASALDPHALITDTMAAGPYLELLPILQWPIFKAFVYREQGPEASRDHGFQEMLRAYNAVLVPHDQGSVSLRVPPGPLVHWCGEMVIRSRTEALSKSAARSELGLPRRGTL